MNKAELSQRIIEVFDDPKDLTALSRRQLGVYVLEHIHTLDPNQIVNASAHNIANDIVHLYESTGNMRSRESLAEIYPFLVDACKWLIENGFLRVIDEQGHVGLTEIGKSSKTANQALAHLGKGSSGQVAMPELNQSAPPNFPRISVSNEAMLWMSAIYDKLRDGEAIDETQLMVELSRKVSREFDPIKIDQRLLLHGSSLTLLGALHVDPSATLIRNADNFFRFMKNRITEAWSVRTVSAEEIANGTGMSTDEVWFVFSLVMLMGKYWQSLPIDENGNKQIGIDEKGVKRAYLDYNSIQDFLNNYFIEKDPAKIDPARRLSPFEHPILSKPQDSSRGQDSTVVKRLEMDGQPTLEQWAGADGPSLALVFTDIVLSTKIGIERGDEAWIRDLQSHFAKGREYCAKSNGFVVKAIGDALLCAFRNSNDAVTFSRNFFLDTGVPHILIRVGIHTGGVHVVDNDIYGLNVNTAARVQRAVSLDGICVTTTVMREVVKHRGAAVNKSFKPAPNPNLKDFPDEIAQQLVEKALTDESEKKRGVIRELLNQPDLFK